MSRLDRRLRELSVLHDQTGVLQFEGAGDVTSFGELLGRLSTVRLPAVNAASVAASRSFLLSQVRASQPRATTQGLGNLGRVALAGTIILGAVAVRQGDVGAQIGGTVSEVLGELGFGHDQSSDAPSSPTVEPPSNGDDKSANPRDELENTPATQGQDPAGTNGAGASPSNRPTEPPGAGSDDKGNKGAGNSKGGSGQDNPDDANDEPADDAPGHSGDAPGQSGTPPGQGGTPPGLDGTPPGQGGTPPGPPDGPPPGHDPPGQGDQEPPGQGKKN